MQIATSLILLIYSGSIFAHHGFTAHFDPDQPIRIEGTIKEFKFINPHSLLYIDTENEQGEAITYMCDMQAKNQMLRHGFDASRIVIGEPIVVEGFQARRDLYQCEYGIGHFADGSSFMLRTIDTARSQFSRNVEPENENKTIFRNWIRPGMYGDESGRGPRVGFNSITEAGKLAQQEFDPIADNPRIHCEAGSPVQGWGAAGLMTSIYESGENISIHYESMDHIRTIHMNGEAAPGNFEASDMGYSVGRWDDEELIIQSSHFKTGVLFGSNLNSDQLTLEERVSVLDNGRLQILWTANEPLYYSDSISGSQVLQATDKAFIPYDCVPEAEY